jgi:4-hydroxybenzoate polyprenyltransferase
VSTGASAVRDLFALARPAQWIKNAFVLAPLVFSQRFFRSTELIGAAVAFTAFCLASSASYVLNDVMDRERDREHPLKSQRPVAAGRVSPREALALAAALAVAAAGVSWALGGLFLAILAAFLAFQVLYSTVLKRIVVVDVATIALLFVLRAAGGVAAVEARMSSWSRCSSGWASAATSSRCSRRARRATAQCWAATACGSSTSSSRWSR